MQEDHEVIVYYNEMVTLWQELDQCYDDEWECPNDSTRHKRKRRKWLELMYFWLNLTKNWMKYEVKS